MRRYLRRGVLIGVACALCVGASGSLRSASAAADSVPGAVQLVGEGGGLSIAVVADARRAAAYVTDGKTRGLWLSGAVRSGAATLSEQAGSTVRVRLAIASARVELPGRAAVEMRLAPATASAGWFVLGRRFMQDARVVRETTSWVRLASGAVRGTRRLESSDGSVSFAPAAASLSGATRVTPELLLLRCLPATSAVSGCALPQAVAKPDSSSLRVLLNPPGSRLTEQQLKAALLRSKSRLISRARAAGLFVMTATDRRLADGWAAKLRASSPFMQASSALRSALLNGGLATAGSRQSDLEDAITQNGLTMPTALRDRVAALRPPTWPRGTPPAKPVGTGTTSILLPADRFAVTEETSTHGDHTSFPNNGGAPLFVLLPTPNAGSKGFLARASAGFSSEAEKSINVTALFTVPPNVQQVEIELERTYRLRIHESTTICVFAPFPLPSGFGYGHSSVMINAERINPDGSTVVADGFHDSTWPSLLPDCGLPVPNPPMLTPNWPLFLRFAPPAQGGSYQLAIYVRADARTMGLASADALAYVELERATVRFRRA